jgi:hypothetical protein
MSVKEAVVYIDPFSKSIIKAAKNNFEHVESIKNHFIGSRVRYDDIITYSFKVHKSISKEDLDIQVELKMYEDVGLKTDRKYKIDYIKKELDYEESYIIEVFALDIEETKDELSFVFEKTKRLDFLALPNLAFETFYKNKILSPKKDIFIYFDEKEAFLSIYKDGKYLSSSSLNTLEEIAKDIEMAISEPFSVKTLRDVLSEKGLDTKRYDESEQALYNALHSVFSDIFYKINNIAMHNRSIFGFDVIERIFLSSVDGRIIGLREFVKSIGFEETELGDFNLFKQKNEHNFLEYIVASYILQKRLSNDNTDNLTFVEKSKPFYKSKAGSFILFAVFAVFAVFAFGSYPVYLFYQNDILTKQRDILQSRYETLQNKTRDIKRQIVKSKLDIKKITDAINSQKEKLSNLDKSIDELTVLTSKEKKSYKTILLLDKYLKKYKLSLSGFEQKQNNRLILDIIAKYERRDDIAKFMKDLMERGFIEVSTKEIKLNENYYISKIEIEK